MSNNPLPKCVACGGPPQRCGSIYYPSYKIHCLKCGNSTCNYPKPESAEVAWRIANTPIEGESSC